MKVIIFVLSFIIYHTDPKIENFTLTPHEVIAVEGSCKNYDKITSTSGFHLQCSASKQLLVVPDLKLYWIYDGLQYNWNTTEKKYSDKSRVTVVSELIVDIAITAISGSYYCVAEIDIPNSRQIHERRESTVTIKSKHTTNDLLMYYNNLVPSAPREVQNLAVHEINSSTLNVTWTVAYVPYTTEKYLLYVDGKEFITYSSHILKYTYSVLVHAKECHYVSVITYNCFGNKTTKYNCRFDLYHYCKNNHV